MQYFTGEPSLTPTKMARKTKRNPTTGKSRRLTASSSNLDTYEDTLEEGGVDDCELSPRCIKLTPVVMFKRDQILFNDLRQEAQDEDVNGYEGEGVLDIPDEEEDDEDEMLDEDDEETPIRKPKTKSALLPDLNRGRFAKQDHPEEDEEDEASGSGSESGSEAWGRQYYSRPSNRRAKEDPLDSAREEERELEENEVKRLQKKSRSELQGEDDWGLTRVIATGYVQPRTGGRC